MRLQSHDSEAHEFTMSFDSAVKQLCVNSAFLPSVESEMDELATLVSDSFDALPLAWGDVINQYRSEADGSLLDRVVNLSEGRWARFSLGKFEVMKLNAPIVLEMANGMKTL